MITLQTQEENRSSMLKVMNVLNWLKPSGLDTWIEDGMNPDCGDYLGICTDEETSAGVYVYLDRTYTLLTDKETQLTAEQLKIVSAVCEAYAQGKI